MAGRLSFSIAINLLTENFRKGSNQVKAAFRSMQTQILTFAAALGAGGIGLSNLVSRFIDVARETNRVTTALKNVSGSMSQYADNQRYLLDLAKKYGLEINALTANYARFAAAASISGMSMMDQRKVFESVSRACTAFGMSADDSNGVMLALSQMMSKGKISSEELRLQMGERLPVALQAMAKAAGVSVGGLDKLMKQGQLMSKDILPKFAEALNGMIPNIDTDNLETSVNRLKNTFTEFVNGTDIQSKYKSLIDWLAETVQSAGENIKNIVIGIVAVISGVVANGAMKLWVSINSTAKQLEAVALRSNASLIAATNNRIAAEIALEKAKVAANNATGAAAIAARQRVTQAQNALVAASAAEQIAIENVKEAELKILDAKKIANAKTTAGALAIITRKRVAAEIELEEAKLGVITANSAQIIAAQQRLAIAQTNLAKITAKEVSAQEAAKAAAAQAASVKSATWWNTACLRMKAAGAKLVVSLKSMWSSFAPMIIVSAIIAIIGKFKAMHDEAQRIKKIFSEYRKEAKSIGNTQEVIMLEKQLKIMNDKKQSQENINNAQAQLQKMLGVEHKSQEELNKLVAKRVELLKETARADFYARKQVEYEDKNKTLSANIGLSSEQTGNLAKLYSLKESGGKKDRDNYYQAIGRMYRENGVKGVYDASTADDAIKEIAKNLNVIADASSELEKSTTNANKLNKTPVAEPDDSKKTPLQKQQESYNKQFEELGAQLEIGKITQAEYNKSLGELNIKMFAQAKGTNNKEVLESEYFKNLKIAAEKAIKNQDKNAALVELEKVQKDYNSKVKENQTLFSKGFITQKELNANIASLSIEAAKSAAGIKGLGDEADVFVTTMQLNAKLLSSSTKVKPRDTTFDYKKTKVDIASESLDKAKELANKYKEEARNIGKTLSDEVANAIANVPSLEEALKLAQVQEDIKNLNKELNESLYSGVKDIASSSDRIVSAFSNLRDVMNDVDASGWERIMAVWNAMTNVVDSFLSIIKMVENLTELTKKLSAAKQVEAGVEQQISNQKIINSAKEVLVDTAASETKKTNSRGVVAANTAEAATAAGKSVAGIPIVGIALAAAAVAGIIAMFATLPKFAKGGIISGGPASGDKILARVNAGEMILNQGQQSRLFEAINSGKLGGGGNMSSTVTTKVRAKDLILTINNELKSQGKKPIS